MRPFFCGLPFLEKGRMFFFFAERKRTKKKPQAYRLTICAKKSREKCGSRTFSCPADKKYGGARRSEKSVRQGTLSRAGQIAEEKTDTAYGFQLAARGLSSNSQAQSFRNVVPPTVRSPTPAALGFSFRHLRKESGKLFY